MLLTKAVVLCCLLLLPVFMGVTCLVIVLFIYSVLCVLFCNHLEGEERANYFTLIVFLMSCGRKWSVALPDGTVG